MSIALVLRSALGLFVAYFGFGFSLFLPFMSHGNFSVLEICIASFSLSVGCLTLLMLVLGVLQILTPYSLLFSVAVISVVSVCFWLYELRKRGKPSLCLGLGPFRFSMTANPQVLAILGGIATLVFLAFYHSLFFPRILWDTLTVYAFLGKRICLDGKIPFFSGSSGSVEWSGNYPMLVPLLYAWFNFCMGDVNDLLSRSIFPVFGLAALIASFALAKRLYGSTAALLSTYVLAVTPMFLTHSTLGYVDIVLTYYFVATLYFLYTACEEKDPKRAFLSGLLGGFAAWTKYQGLILAFIVAAYWLMIRLHDKKVDGIFLRVLMAFAVSAVPWYLRNWVLLGNPVYPNLFTFFGGKNLDLWLLSYNYDYWIGRWAVLLGTDRSSSSLLSLPLRLLIRDDSLSSLGQDGMGFLLAGFGIPGLLLSVLKRRKGDLLLLSSISIFFSFWFFFLYYFIRYLLPIVPMLSILAGRLLSETVSDLGKNRKLRKVLLSFIILPPLFIGFLIPTAALALTGPSYTFRDYIFSRPFALPSTEEALRHAMPADYALWQFMNERTPPESVFLSFDHRWYFVNRKLAFADSTEMKEIYFVSNASQAVDFLLSVNVTHIVVEPWYNEIPLWYKSPLFRDLDDETHFVKVFDERGYRVYKIEGEEL